MLRISSRKITAEELSWQININFLKATNHKIKSLKFFRKTPWAREKS